MQHTKHLNLNKVDYGTQEWHEYLNNNFDIIDEVIAESNNNTTVINSVEPTTHKFGRVWVDKITQDGQVIKGKYKIDNGTDYNEMHFETEAELVKFKDGKNADEKLAECQEQMTSQYNELASESKVSNINGKTGEVILTTEDIKNKKGQTIDNVIAESNNELKNKINNIKIPVQSINSKTGNVVLTTKDIKRGNGNNLDKDINDMASDINTLDRNFVGLSQQTNTQYEDLTDYNKNYYKNFGVNLIKNSGYIKDLKYWAQQTGGGAEQKDFCIETGYNGLMSGASLTCTKMVQHGWCILANTSLMQNEFKFIVGETYTISGYIWSNKNSDVWLQICDGSATNFVYGEKVNCTSGYNYFCYTFNAKISGNENQIRFSLGGDKKIFIPFVKLEIGNIATTWSKNNLEILEEIKMLDNKFTLRNAGYVEDFNNMLIQNEYHVGCGKTIPNAPYTGAIFGKLFVYVNDGYKYNGVCNWIWQIFINTSGQIFKRRKINANDWTTWVELPSRTEMSALNKRIDSIEKILIEKGFTQAKNRLNI